MNKLLFCGAVFGLMSVIMGAAGDHWIGMSADTTHVFNTAVRYNMVYAAIIIAFAINQDRCKFFWPLVLFIIGSFIFCISIYLFVFTGSPMFTHATPVGGVILMAAWISLIIKACGNNKP